MEIESYHNEANIFAAIAAGDQSALVELFNWYYTQLGYAMFDLTGSVDLAEQAVQDAFVMVWLQKEELARIIKWDGYLFAISRNMAYASMNERKMRKECSITSITDHPLLSSRELVAKGIERLPRIQKQILSMTRNQKLDAFEIGRLLNMSPELVTKYVHDALKSIRMELCEHMPSCVAVVLTSTLMLDSRTKISIASKN